MLLSSVLPDAANLGYQELRDVIVERVNGQPVGSLADLRQAFASPQGGFHVVEFVAGQGAARAVLDAEEAGRRGGPPARGLRGRAARLGPALNPPY